MVDSGSAARRFLNPWVLHLQKLGLELKCPLCLNLFDQPMLLPCDHIFCKSCIDVTLTKFECPICNVVCLNSAIRSSPHTENLVSVFRNMDTTLSTVQQQPANSGAEICSMTAAVRRCTSIDMQERLCGSSNSKSKDGSQKGKCSNDLLKSAMKSDAVVNFEKGSTTISEADGNVEQGDIVTETNQVSQSAPDSYPSLGGPRGYDDSSDQCSERSLKGSLTVVSLQEKCNKASVGKNGRSQEHESHDRDAKRQKTSLCDFSGTPTKSINQQEVDSSSTKSIKGPPTSEQSLHANPSIESKTKCAFCQSSKVSQKTGPMLHYASDGVPVKGDEVNRPNIIHVHEICINWAPQVYFKDDNVKKLKGEVARGAKLKCSKCGRKGAALGCYEKSCKKSFHVTCAMEISGCRWNLDDFLMLCPNHASTKFPDEKSHIVKNTTVEDAVPYKMSKDLEKLWVTSETGAKEWLFCGSALTNDEKLLMMKLSTKLGIRVTKYWKPDVTHVIASTDANGACCRTLKVLMGISHGIWILKIDWIKACLEAQRPVDEEPYEVSIDNHGCTDGPKTGRLRALSNGPKIFAGLQFLFSGYFVPGFKRDLHNLLTAAGGTIINSAQELAAMTQEGRQAVIIYNLDLLNEGEPSNRTLLVQQRCEEAMNLARRVGDRVVAHTWLLESIAACKLLPWVM
ncbi:unnamed protein product [Rhodiola kirilowii]